MSKRPDTQPALALGQRIRVLRDRLRLTQTAFGQLLYVAQPTVARWEGGRHMPDEPTIRRIAALGRVSPADLRYGIEDEADAPVLATRVVGELGADWRLTWTSETTERVPAPAAADPAQTAAIRVRAEGLAPLRPGWLVFYARDSKARPKGALGKLSVVQPVEPSHALLGELQLGSRRQRFDLTSWNGTVWRDLKIAWAAPVIEIRPYYG
jgi:transcriptional regulator with XRE-family HTH domain